MVASDVSDATLQVTDHIIDVGAGTFPQVAARMEDLNVRGLVAAPLGPWNYMICVMRSRVEPEFACAFRATPLLPLSDVDNYFARPKVRPTNRLHFLEKID